MRGNTSPSTSEIESLVVLASESFSLKHEERARTTAGLNEVKQILKERVLRNLAEIGYEVPEPIHVDLKRWRYAFVKNPADTSRTIKASVDTSPPLYVTGDVGGKDIESCILHATKTAERLKRELDVIV